MRARPKTLNRLVSFGLVIAALALLGGYRLFFGALLLGRGETAALADVVFQSSYLFLVGVLGASGAAALYQRHLGERLAREDAAGAGGAFWRGLLWCAATPLALDLVLRSVGGPVVPASWLWIPLLGAYQFVKPICFSHRLSRRLSLLEGGSAVAAAGLLVAGLVHPSLYLPLFLAPQTIVVVGALPWLAKRSGAPCFGRGTALGYLVNLRQIAWGTAGVGASTGLLHLLTLLGEARLPDHDYAVYGILLHGVAALNLLNRSVGLFLLPHFTRTGVCSGEEAARRLFLWAFALVSTALLPVACIAFFLLPLILPVLLDDLDGRLVTAAQILALYALTQLPLGLAVNYQIGAGRFQLPHIGSLLGAALGATMLFVDDGAWGLAATLLVASLVNLLVNLLGDDRRQEIATPAKPPLFPAHPASRESTFRRTGLREASITPAVKFGGARARPSGEIPRAAADFDPGSI